MKRNVVILVIVVVAVLLAGGAYMLYNNGYKSSPSSSSNSAKDNSLPDVNNSVLTTKTDSKVGKYLATPSGAPLYTYASDSNSVSNCSGACLSNWPAYQATGDTSNLPAGVGVMTRSDNGQKQYTYNGMPLYTFTSDSNGQVTGDGVEGFHVAKPATDALQSTTSPSASASSTATPSATPTSSPAPTQTSSSYPY